MSSEEDPHCDSLAGAALYARALSVAPSRRPAREKRGLKFAAWLTVGALLGAAGFGATGGVAKLSLPEALRVEGRTVSYSAAFAEQAGIRTMEVQELPFSPIVSARGKASLDPEQVAAIGASALGTVRRVLKYEGESVKRGEVLAELASAAQAGREAAGSMRAQRLPARPLGVSLLRSPLDGTVVERRIITGQSVRGERVVFVVANLDRLSLTLSVDEAQARRLRLGDRVELMAEAPAAALSSGKVTEVEAASADASAKLRVSIAVDNRARSLRAGQAVNARIFASTASRVLLVPNRALAWIGGQPAVFVAASAHSASAAAVTLGGCNGEQTEVRLGLASGQRIVSDGVSRLQAASFL
ncbi:MAG TPA: efflux RND transporter periplasmic adaptor subunit [Polyangiaceae bacterium]